MPCPAGYRCPPGTSAGTAYACSPGSYSTVGASDCTPCPAGQYGSTAALSTATCTAACSAGYFCPAGSAVYALNPCPAGYMCPLGTANGTQYPCASGTYSVGSASSCSSCAAGLYGGSSALGSVSCSGPCAVGRYGSSSGMTTSDCSGPCDAGRYGGSSGLTDASCTGNCSAGYACPAGSTNATAVQCAPGQYSLSGYGSCVNCSAGLYGSAFGLSTASCSGPCDAGRYGSECDHPDQRCQRVFHCSLELCLVVQADSVTRALPVAYHALPALFVPRGLTHRLQLGRAALQARSV